MNDLTVDFYTLIATAIIRLVAGIVIVCVIPVVVKWLREKNLYSTAATLVKTAKTLFNDNCGEEKFAWVYERLSEKIGKYFDVDELRNAIQAAYVDMKLAMGEKPTIITGEEKTGEDNDNENID